MNELSGAVASVQIQKLPRIVELMRTSKRRIKAMLHDVPGLTFRRMNDAEGDTGPFLIIFLETETLAASVVERMKAAGLHNVFQVSRYGLHMYYNIPSLVNKVPLSPAGNPWRLVENAQSAYSYTKGVCPRSDALFGRAVLLPIPSPLTEEQEKAAAEIIRQSVSVGIS